MKLTVTNDKANSGIVDRWNLYADGKFVGTWRGTKADAKAQSVIVGGQVAAYGAAWRPV